jgi:ATP-dependent Clp protease ATP-binding subunit ClpC
MYEDFTNRACVVMQMANEEARRLNQEYMSTEHVLLGLIREGVRTQKRPGVAAKVLQEFGILDLRRMRVEVEKVTHAEPATTVKRDLVQSSHLQQAIDYAFEEAARLNLPDIGTGFLLLGILRESEGVAARVLRNLGLNAEDMRDRVLILLRR